MAAALVISESDFIVILLQRGWKIIIVINDF